MDPKSKQTLMLILEKSVPELTSDDIAFLQARRSYLNADQLEKFKKVLTEEVEETPEKSLDKMNKAELIEMGKKLKVDTNVPKKELIDNILKAQEK